MLSQVWKAIDNHNTKRTFMRGVRQSFPRDSHAYLRILDAYDKSQAGHGYDRRDTGERYFRHVLAVACIILFYLKIKDPDLVIAAFYHDLPEDKPIIWPIERVLSEVGKRVDKLVEAVTKPSKLRYIGNRTAHRKVTFNKIERAGKFAIVLKLADRLHNMLTLWGTSERKHDKIHETVRYVLPLAVKVGVLVDELLLAIAEQIKSKNINDELVSEVGHNGQ